MAEEPAQGYALVLASSSPRRRELLSCLGTGFSVVWPSTSESLLPCETPDRAVERLALSKAMSVASPSTRGITVGADSLVVLDGRALGKPADGSEARRMLEDLRGREHQVVTGVAAVDASGGRVRTGTQVSAVTMRHYSDEEIAAYVASGEPIDKAGAYAVQDAFFRPAARLEGCYTNVMGLPLCLLVELLARLGYPLEAKTRSHVPDECTQCPLRGTSRAS